MTATDMPIEEFLFFLSYFGLHLDNPAVAMVMDEFGLTDREAITEAEMGRVLHALAEVAREGLARAERPEAASYARLMNLGAGLVDLTAMPE